MQSRADAHDTPDNSVGVAKVCEDQVTPPSVLTKMAAGVPLDTETQTDVVGHDVAEIMATVPPESDWLVDQVKVEVRGEPAAAVAAVASRKTTVHTTPAIGARRDRRVHAIAERPSVTRPLALAVCIAPPPFRNFVKWYQPMSPPRPKP